MFGADLPVDGGKGGHFSWRDGLFLQALKSGHWIVLDEVRGLKINLTYCNLIFSASDLYQNVI